MKTKAHEKRAISQIALFVSACFLMGLALHSCQKDEAILSAEGMELQGVQGSEITLDFPVEDVVAGTDFLIAFSSSCGRIMIERGFIEEVDPITGETTCVYSGLDCDADDLMWEEIGTGGFSNCGGGIITQNLSAPGTYVYRAKLNFRAERDADCPECGDFRGNRFECFTVTVAAENGNGNGGTFTDARDERVYKTVTIGAQTWMAENLAYHTGQFGSWAYDNNDDNVAIYGRLYDWNTAKDVCPAGWKLPSNADWNELIDYLNNNGYAHDNNTNWVAKAVASTSGWFDSTNQGSPGCDPGSNNSSGFNGLPGGHRTFMGSSAFMGQYGYWWSSDTPDEWTANCRVLCNWVTAFYQDGLVRSNGFSVRCIKTED